MKRPNQPLSSVGKMHARLQAAMGAFLATMLALPASAGITLPSDPLQSSGRIAPNILFILDDSGSMAWEYMDSADVTTVSGAGLGNIGRSAYTSNTIFYNPAVTYGAWLDSTGTPQTGGTSYNSAFASFNYASDPIDLANTASCVSVDYNGATPTVCGGTQTFYVPKNPANTTVAYLTNAANYYRFQIHTDGVVVRSERQNISMVEAVTGRNCPTGVAGTWNWKNCSVVTPTGRTPAAERQNYATWFSYHRSRMKTAKAGSGSAFSDLGKDVRVGFRTIWGRDLGGNPMTEASPILVNRNDGIFDDPNGVAGAFNNRSVWYQRLYGARAQSGTPLKGALQAAGTYFSSSSADGAYGPQTGAAQFACRQNFAILTTDGYWNDNSRYVSVNEQDNSAGTTITSPTGQSYTYAPAAPFASADSNTLADVAMRYWKTDLRTDLENIVPTSSANPAYWQHMATFGISIGLKGAINPNDPLPGTPGGAAGWPNPNDAEDVHRIDDLYHASVNGRGKFLAASDPEEFTSGLRSALAAITERTGSFSNVGINSTSIDAGTQLFQGSYVSGVWTGELKAYAVTSSGIAAAPTWLASAGIPTTGRNIFTFDGTIGTTFPTAAQTTALARPGPIAADLPVVTGANNAAYIAGNRTLELANGGTLRNRNHLLGDIVTSSPAYDKATSTIYVGANDGMLHAINATDGTERFAYIPAGIDFSLLKTLSKPDYAHQYFVDGPITVSNRLTQTPGQSILVGTLGRGGKGIYALDVTTPAAFAASNVKWERTSTPGNNMGLVLGQPIIAKLNNGDMGLIVPNGINSANDRAALLIYRLSDGALLAEIDTGVGSAVAPNGLSAPTTRDLDGNGTVDSVYAGDLQGNLWKFNLSAASPTTWSNAGSRMVLFTATDAGGLRQPITSAPALARDPATFQLWVFFGTGRFLTVGDVATQTVQSMYGLKDSTSPITSRATQLQQRRVVVAGFSGGRPVRGFEAASALTPGLRGWFVDLVMPPSPPGTPQGERIVSDAQVVAGALITSSIVPSTDPCQPGGSGYLNAINAFTGASLGSSFFDLDGDGVFTDEVIPLGAGYVPVGSVDTGVGMPTLSQITNKLLLVCGSGGTCEDPPVDLNTTTGRVSWREVIRD